MLAITMGRSSLGAKSCSSSLMGKIVKKDSKYLRNVVLNGVFFKAISVHQTKTFNENSQFQIQLVKHTYYEYNKNLAIPIKEFKCLSNEQRYSVQLFYKTAKLIRSQLVKK